MSTADCERPLPHDRGLYLLVMRLEESIHLAAGKLPETLLDPGSYLYVGRAKKNLRARVARHLRSRKRLFWHIDYLLQYASIDKVGYRFDLLDECRTVRSLQKHLPGCRIPLPNFGASDCHCQGHLLYWPERELTADSLGSLYHFAEVAL